VTTLQEYYVTLGLPPSRWHIGAEHPSLEQHAIARLGRMPGARVLEIGYQSGGFAVPVILAMHARRDFSYLGVDALVYGNAVEGDVIGRYLDAQGARRCWEFRAGDAADVVRRLRGPFDLVLIDHDKRLYPRELLAVLRRGLVSRDGCVLLHDVLGKARAAWHDCAIIAAAHGHLAAVVPDVPGGLAVLTPGSARTGARRDRIRLLAVLARIQARSLSDALRAAARRTRTERSRDTAASRTGR
jgi:methyltransferase family protein